ncbi:NAD-dependent deacylase [Microbacter margulisiae]|uniref:protein acetyllysine N-acetyltransferase n=1 Tax=Microbacter margulisiae TaxID=1350067 RepID=A0A7W5DR39_9PORP|nr:NAD-dependent deacylase [Microbacter margulisiae]MBB3187540.1 NAD-dependent deacetylase [Microbacter margulisiae]
MKRLVVLTGAGISAESGIRTFRDSGGLWESYRVEDVASPEGWATNPTLVLNFYAKRRAELLTASPNDGHKGLVRLEEFFKVDIITQNIDNLHEKAGSTHVLHLHGELNKVCSSCNPSYIITLPEEAPYIKLGDKCPLGCQLRPFVVWFGESVPAIEQAIDITQQADIFAIVGTSMNVYPAAGLIHYLSSGTPIYLIDPQPVETSKNQEIHFIQQPASLGIPILEDLLKSR